MSHAALARHVAAVAAALREAGVGRRDAVAVVTPNGPEAAAAFLSTASAAVSAPLNPAYRREDFDFYLGDVGARALLVWSALDTPARDAARALGVPVIELSSPAGATAGTLALDGRVAGGAAAIEAPSPADVALVLHTSGTTSRPKMVPLTHGNLAASARSVGAALALGPRDRCLNVMPLFHIHGLVAATLASLAAGAGVVCTPGFAADFLGWIDSFRPTWYTAVPTMHQAVLAATRGEPRATSLRFIRSSSAALPRRTMAELERVFGVPVVEAYGMTEAAHQMASNPLPPRVRKPGSVGVAAGPEVAVMDAAGAVLPPNVTGEVVVRGPNVTSGYVGDPAANAAAFAPGGWLRTGDQGWLDDDGYLFLSGRLKELINRGGEKVSPLEVDEALMEHPAVAQAVAFAIPHPTLGEEVAAAVVLRPGADGRAAAVGERELRAAAAARLPYFKVPRRIVVVDAIPKGATGKLQRIGLAERLGVGASAAGAEDDGGPPRGPVEEVVAAFWAELLPGRAPRRHDDFFAAGGDSITAAQLVGRLRDALAVELPLLDLFDAPTPAGIAAALEPLLAADDEAAPGAPLPAQAWPARR
jgi:acyl-CoA synthetase (AMP-forming)/AMP-acid ligase II/acyl carrier protein